MSELRQNSITGQWVLIAPERDARPREFLAVYETPVAADCPFCDQHENETPEEIVARRPDLSAPNRPGWRVRVVPNKYPALAHSVRSLGTVSDGGRSEPPAVGAHEVIIESPDHITRTGQMSDRQLAEVLSVYRDRYRSLASERSNPPIRFVLIFKNVGPEAGATIEHSHSQLIGLPIVPAQIEQELRTAHGHFEQRQQCIYCNLIARETVDKQRIVAITEHFVAFCPYASTFSYETWILPRKHASQFATMNDSQCDDCAALLREILLRIDDRLDQPAYNYVVQSAPFDTRSEAHYHWRIAIMPRIATLAGFELGTGCAINPVAPERAAQLLQIHTNGE